MKDKRGRPWQEKRQHLHQLGGGERRAILPCRPEAGKNKEPLQTKKSSHKRESVDLRGRGKEREGDPIYQLAEEGLSEPFKNVLKKMPSLSLLGGASSPTSSAKR